MERWSGNDKLAVALACVGAVMTLVLFWIDKTPTTAGLTLAAIVLLMVYPILHFVQSRTGKEIAFVALALLVGFFGWRIWPKKVIREVPKFPQEEQRPQNVPTQVEPQPRVAAAPPVKQTRQNVPKSKPKLGQAGSPQPVSVPTPIAPTVPTPTIPPGGITAGPCSNVQVGGTANQQTGGDCSGFKVPHIVGRYDRLLAPIPGFVGATNGADREQRRQAWIASLGMERHGGYNSMYTSNPGLEVSFHVDATFVDPRFRIECVDCVSTVITCTNGDGNQSVTIPQLPALLTPDTEIDLFVRSTVKDRPLGPVQVVPVSSTSPQ